MDRELLAAALRVLTSRLDGRRPGLDDVDLIRRNAIFQEKDYELEDIACSVIQRVTMEHRLESVR